MVAAPVTDSVSVSAVGDTRVVVIGVPVHVRHTREGRHCRAGGRSKHAADPDVAKPMVVSCDEVSRDEHQRND